MITLANYEDHEQIIHVWEQSVRASHEFLTEEYLQEIKPKLPSILQQVKTYVYRGNEGNIKGFIGIAGHKMEMLFIHPDHFNQQIGSQLAKFCVHSLNVDEADVNEQNHTALRFYEKMGYRPTGRDEIDALGKPYPILHLKFGSVINATRPVPNYPSNKYQLANS